MEDLDDGGLDAERPFSLERFMIERMQTGLRYAAMNVLEGYGIDRGSACVCADMLLSRIDFDAYEDVACFLLKGWVADHVDLVEDWLGELEKGRGCNLCKRG